MPIFKTTSTGNFSQTEIFVDQCTTTDATPKIAYSYPVLLNQCVKVTAEFTAMQSDFSKASTGEMFATFLRTTGNISRTVSPTTGLGGAIQGNFALPLPTLDLVANATTQKIDFTVTGKLATTIIWNIKLTISPYA